MTLAAFDRAGLDPSEIDAWIFDLDNTLYPADSGLFGHVAARMTRYIADHFGIDDEEAGHRRRQYFLDHGTTLRGLMDEHGLDPTPFLEFVHDIDLSSLTPDETLVAAIRGLKGRKYVFTNADGPYARRIIARIGLDGLIDDVFDIREAHYVPKPAPETYARMVERLGIAPERAVMVEDMARNLTPAAALGMTTVWLRTGTPWGSDPAPEGVVHHEIDDLARWIAKLGSGLDQPG
jgi:putative hydrolase of the HAD superfamily